jgi:HD domain
MNRRSQYVLHLAKRFFTSLSTREPAVTEALWAESQLLAGELRLWLRMSAADRRHAIGVARETVRLLGPATTRPVVAAALLHDMGKIDSALGPIERALATVVNPRTGESRWARYRRHDVIGAELLVAAGSDPLTIAWTREHHLEPERWTVERTIAVALKQADDD